MTSSATQLKSDSQLRQEGPQIWIPEIQYYTVGGDGWQCWWWLVVMVVMIGGGSDGGGDYPVYTFITWRIGVHYPFYTITLLHKS